MPIASDAVGVHGLNEFVKNLKKLDNDLPKALRLSFNEISKVVVDDAEKRIPTVSGRARRSIKAKSTQKAARLSGGSKGVPYYGWLDFGGEGRVKGRPGKRPVKKEGRYLYAAYFKHRDEIPALMEQALLEIAEQAGVEID